MPYLDRDGARIYFEVHGQGPAILLTSGFAAESGMWKGQIEPFSENHTLITWDMRGHGRTKTPAQESAFSQSLTTKDMAALLDETGFDRAIIGGLSLGGYMSLAFHADFRERVKALLIIDTGPGFKKDESRDKWNVQANRMADALAEKGLAGLPGLTPEMARANHEDMDGLVRAGRHMLTQHNDKIIQSLPSIEVPAIVIVGENDKPYLAGADYMAGKIPSAKKCIIPDAGHAVNIDQPEHFNREVLEFLKENGL